MVGGRGNSSREPLEGMQAMQQHNRTKFAQIEGHEPLVVLPLTLVATETYRTVDAVWLPKELEDE